MFFFITRITQVRYPWRWQKDINRILFFSVLSFQLKSGKKVIDRHGTAQSWQDFLQTARRISCPFGAGDSHCNSRSVFWAFASGPSRAKAGSAWLTTNQAVEIARADLGSAIGFARLREDPRKPLAGRETRKPQFQL